MITGCYHTSFTVRNLERSVAFYRDTLGLELKGVQGGAHQYLRDIVALPEADLKIAFIGIPGSDHVLELIEYVAPRGIPADTATCNVGSAHLCFRCDDLPATYAAWQAKGVHFKSLPVRIPLGRNAGGYAVYFLDPDGITLELFQPPLA